MQRVQRAEYRCLLEQYMNLNVHFSLEEKSHSHGFSHQYLEADWKSGGLGLVFNGVAQMGWCGNSEFFQK